MVLKLTLFLSIKAYQESELTQAKESLLNSSENRRDFEEQVIALQRENKELKALLQTWASKHWEFINWSLSWIFVYL